MNSKEPALTWSPGGGHLFCSDHGIQDTLRALDNVLAFYWAFHQFGKYPIGV